MYGHKGGKEQQPYGDIRTHGSTRPVGARHPYPAFCLPIGSFTNGIMVVKVA
jgi:hypothetical protein